MGATLVPINMPGRVALPKVQFSKTKFVNGVFSAVNVDVAAVVFKGCVDES